MFGSRVAHDGFSLISMKRTNFFSPIIIIIKHLNNNNKERKKEIEEHFPLRVVQNVRIAIFAQWRGFVERARRGKEGIEGYQWLSCKDSPKMVRIIPAFITAAYLPLPRRRNHQWPLLSWHECIISSVTTPVRSRVWSMIFRRSYRATMDVEGWAVGWGGGGGGGQRNSL